MPGKRSRRRDRLPAMLLGHDLPKHLCLANHQRPPRQITSGEPVTLGGDQHIPNNVGITERIAQELSPADDAQQLERRIRASGGAVFPVAYGALGHFEHRCHTVGRPTVRKTQLAKLSRPDELETRALTLGPGPCSTSHNAYYVIIRWEDLSRTKHPRPPGHTFLYPWPSSISA